MTSIAPHFHTDLNDTQKKQRIQWIKQKSRKIIAEAKKQRYKLLYNSNIGKNAQLRGIQETAQIFGIEHSAAAYWLKKQQDPTFHAKTHGGARLNCFLLKSINFI